MLSFNSFLLSVDIHESLLKYSSVGGADQQRTIDKDYTMCIEEETYLVESMRVAIVEKIASGETPEQIRTDYPKDIRAIQRSVRKLFAYTELRDKLINTINGESIANTDLRQKARSIALFDKYGAGVVADPTALLPYVGEYRREADDAFVSRIVRWISRPANIAKAAINPATSEFQQRVRIVGQGPISNVDMRRSLLIMEAPSTQQAVNRLIAASEDVYDILWDAGIDLESEMRTFSKIKIPSHYITSVDDERDWHIVDDTMTDMTRIIASMVDTTNWEAIRNMSSFFDRIRHTFSHASGVELTKALVKMEKLASINECNEVGQRDMEFQFGPKKNKKRARTEVQASDDAAAAPASSGDASSAMVDSEAK